VALHVLSADARDPTFNALFHAHGDILARLDHRHPAPAGRRRHRGRTAYLAFEYAAGDPVDDWCWAHNLKLRDRAARVLAVSEVVQHLHEHLIAHGDLRPANILVSADAGVRVLDAGMPALLGFARPPTVHLRRRTSTRAPSRRVERC